MDTTHIASLLLPCLLAVVLHTAHATENSVCSVANIAAGRMYHPVFGRPDMYLQCDEWGQAHLMPCTSGQLWDQMEQTCRSDMTKPLSPPQHLPQLAPQQHPPPPPYTRKQGYQQPSLQSQSQPSKQYQPQQPSKQYQPKQPSKQYQPQQPSKNYAFRGDNQDDYPPPAMMYGPQAMPGSMISRILAAGNMQMATVAQGSPRGQYNQQTSPASKDYNICMDPNTRYIPELSNLHHFFECRHGSMLERQCPPEEVWVAPIRRCMNPETTQMKPSHSPCMASDKQFHPFPGNSAQYIDCQTWFTIYIWTCGPGQLWVQPLQGCLDVSEIHKLAAGKGSRNGGGKQPEPPRPRSTAMPATPRPLPPRPIDPSNPCHKGSHETYTSFYYPYPNNPTKFIQCDDHGNMHIRKCGHSKIWDDSAKTCAGDPTGFVDAGGDGGTGSYGGTGAGSSSGTGGGSYVGVKPDYGGGDGPGLDCAEGFDWEESLQACVSYVDSLSEALDGNGLAMGPNCQEGLYWDARQQMCVPPDAASPPDFGEIPDWAMGLNDNNYNNANVQGRSQLEGEHWTYNPPVYAGENPCGQNRSFYFAFPGEPHYFLQCDQLSNLYVQPCGIGEIWSEDILTCVPDLEASAGTHSHGGAEAGANGDTEYGDYNGVNTEDDNLNIDPNIDTNPCVTSQQTYHPHADPHLFIMCVGHIPYPMPCPYGSRWQKAMRTCFWPNKQMIG